MVNIIVFINIIIIIISQRKPLHCIKLIVHLFGYNILCWLMLSVVNNLQIQVIYSRQM